MREVAIVEAVVKRVSNAAEISNIEEAWFRNRRDVLSIRQIYIKDNTKVPSRVNRRESYIIWLTNSRRAEFRELLWETNDEKLRYMIEIKIILIFDNAWKMYFFDKHTHNNTI